HGSTTSRPSRRRGATRWRAGTARSPSGSWPSSRRSGRRRPSPEGGSMRAGFVGLGTMGAPMARRLLAAGHDVTVHNRTRGPAAARRRAGGPAARGAAMLGAPVRGGREGAGNGTPSVMVGGEAEALERARPRLGVLGRTITHVGPSGAGQVAKAVNQVIIAG